MSGKKPVIIADPFPQTLERIFSPEDKKRLDEMAEVISTDSERMSPELFESHLGDASAIIGQTPMPKERLDRAPNLKAIFNVEGNFYQNIDYSECFRRNIRVLNCGLARPVAEMAPMAKIRMNYWTSGSGRN